MADKVIDLSHHFSHVSKARQKSEIDDKFNHGFAKGASNLAAGLPNPQFYPWRTIEAEVLQPPDVSLSTQSSSPHLPKLTSSHLTVPYHLDAEDGTDIATVLQYGPPDGLPRLVNTVRTLTREHLHRRISAQREVEVILSNGSTDGMSKCLELFTNAWSARRDLPSAREGILTEVFMYAAVLTQAEPRGLNIAPVQIDQQGMMVDGKGGLRDVLENWDVGRGQRPHLMYTVSIGNNPTGSVLHQKRRQEVYDICCKFDVVIIEDEPYWFLQYGNDEETGRTSRGSSLSRTQKAGSDTPGNPFIESLEPSFIDIDVQGRVVRLDTFSKMFAPGCRLGWVTASPQVIERLERITECFAHQPCGFVQGIVTTMIESCSSETGVQEKVSGQNHVEWQIDGWMSWLRHTRDVYQDRMKRTCQILERRSTAYTSSTVIEGSWSAVSKVEIFSFQWPRAGMFVWLRFHFDRHPLWQIPRTNRSGTITGKILSEALSRFLQQRPYQIMAASGMTFGATRQIREEQGWKFYRLCFAAEDDDCLDDAVQRFADGVRAFWDLKSPKNIEELLGDDA